jgi:hypothetical protein
MVSTFDASQLLGQDVDSCQFDLVEETSRGSMYFQPMSQERLDTLHKRPDFKEIPFAAEDDGWPSEHDAYWVQDTINEQLDRQKYEPETMEDLWTALEFTSWERVGLVHLTHVVLYIVD